MLRFILFALLLAATYPGSAQQPQPIELTLESAVRLAMEQSYNVRQLRLGIEQTRHRLRAERASLKSNVSLDITTPQFEAISEYEYLESVAREVLVRQNSRMWRMNLSVRQPVILFGWPTNGYLSLNSRLYRYTQIDRGERFTRYYNRYFIAYEQPLFQPNELENELTEARLDVEGAALDYKENVVDLIGDVADDYYELFDIAYQRFITSRLIEDLEDALAAAQRLAGGDSSRIIEVSQARIELANARESLQQIRSSFRLEASRMKQRLRLDPSDSLHIAPRLVLEPIDIDVARAIQLALRRPPRLRELEIRMREAEIDLEETLGENSFQLELELTYGREMADPLFTNIWEQPRNSYTVGVSGYIPVWDWGASDARAQAARIDLQQIELRMEEARNNIRSDVRNLVRTLEEYQARALDMRQNLTLARQVVDESLNRYLNGQISMLALLQSIERENETAQNYLDTYLGYRSALVDLQQRTYHNFSRDLPLLDRFGISASIDMDY